MAQTVQNLPTKWWDPGLISELGRSPGGGYGNPLQDSCLENSMDRGSWQATVHGVTESDRIEWLSTAQHIHICLPRCLSEKESSYQWMGSIPGMGRSPWEGNGNPLQYSRLRNPMDGGAWRAIVHGVAKSGTWLRDYTTTMTICVCVFLYILTYNKV